MRARAQKQTMAQFGPGRRCCRHGEAGVVVAEFVIIVTVLVAFVAFLVGMGQLYRANAEVTDAARNGAQAAVIAANSSQAQPNAQSAVQATLAPVQCTTLGVVADTHNFGPGGSVTVTVSCTITLSDAGLIGVPGSVTIVKSRSAPMELYRNG